MLKFLIKCFQLLLLSFITMLAWNYSVAELFELKEITYFQSIWLVILTEILFLRDVKEL